MNWVRTATWVWLFALFALRGVAAAADEPSCREMSHIAITATAKSSRTAVEEKRKAGDSYRAKVVFAARTFELHPMDREAAARLLDLIPLDDSQHTVLMTMGDSLCDAESVGEMKSLGALGDRLPNDLARAVLLVPGKLPEYVAFAPTAVGDPHSDYAVQMQTVCRTKHAEFVKAVEGLPTERKDLFVTHVFNPESCRALALPEAE